MAEFRHIMVPVDLAHRDKLDKALSVAADLGKRYGAPVTLVGAAAPEPSAVARTFAEFAGKLQALADEEAVKSGVETKAKAVDCPDPRRDLDDALAGAAEEIGADLVVMASHVPTFADHVLASNAGALASHTEASVFIVR